MHTKTRIFPSLSQVLVLFQLGKTRRIARERSCLCRFSYKHRNVFSFQLFHGIGPAACLDKPFLIALIQAKETQHLHRLVFFDLLVFSVVFHVGKRGMLVLDTACLSWLGEFSRFQSLISDRSLFSQYVEMDLFWRVLEVLSHPCSRYLTINTWIFPEMIFDIR